MTIRIKRVYEDAAATDGYRVLVDRVWPRGMTKAAANVGEWLKEIGPSTGLRTWFGHDPEKFAEFAQRYRQELAGNDSLTALRAIVAEHDTVTLVYSAKDEEHNQALVLKQVLEVRK